MNKNLPDFSEPAISAIEGWNKMQELLDAHLPVENIKRKRVLLLPYSVAACLFVLFMFQSVQLRNTIQFEVCKAPIKFEKTGTNKDLVENNVTHESSRRYSNISNTQKLEWRTLSNGNPTHSPVVYNPHKSLAVHELEPVSNEFLKSSEPVIVVDNNKKISEKINGSVTNEKRNEESKTGTAPKGWNLLAGLGVNMNPKNNDQVLQPYPVLKAEYNISSKFYVAVGLGFYSPISSKNSGIDKSAYVRDTTNTISAYNQRLNISRMYYLDLPVVAGIKITKHLSVEAGIQTSLLLHSKSNRSSEANNLRLAPADVPSSFLMGLVSNVEKQYELNTQKVDYRLLGGVKYNLKKYSLGLTYQQGFKPVLEGSNTDTRKNEVVSLKFLYVIK